MLENHQSKGIYYLFYMLIVSALFGPTVKFRISENFHLTFFRVVLLFLIVVLIYRVLKGRLETTHLYSVRLFFAFFFIWVVYTVVSLSWVFNLEAGLTYTLKLLSMLVFTFLIIYFLKEEALFWKTQKMLFYMLCCIIYFGVIESLNPFIHLPTSRVFGRIAGIVTSVFHNENDLATFITLALPFLITSLYLLNIRLRYKIWIYITATMALYILFATGSRSNTLLALPLILLTMFFMTLRVVERSKLTRKNVATVLALLFLSITLVSLMNVVYLSPEARNSRNSASKKIWNSTTFFNDVKNGWSLEGSGDEIISGTAGKSAKVRKYLVLNGLKFLHNSYYLGVGPGNIEPLMEKYGAKVDKVNMHNWWAEVLVNFGLIIFIMYIATYLWILKKLYSISCTTSHSSLIRWGAVSCFSSLIGFFAGGIASSTAIHFTPFWMSYGLGVAIIAITEKTHTIRRGITIC